MERKGAQKGVALALLPGVAQGDGVRHRGSMSPGRSMTLAQCYQGICENGRGHPRYLSPAKQEERSPAFGGSIGNEVNRF